MALVVFEVESLSKVMTDMVHMFAFDEADRLAPWEKIEGELSRANTF